MIKIKRTYNCGLCGEKHEDPATCKVCCFEDKQRRGIEDPNKTKEEVWGMLQEVRFLKGQETEGEEERVI